jgi:hypothetical protein
MTPNYLKYKVLLPITLFLALLLAAMEVGFVVAKLEQASVETTATSKKQSFRESVYLANDKWKATRTKKPTNPH